MFINLAITKIINTLSGRQLCYGRWLVTVSRFDSFSGIYIRLLKQLMLSCKGSKDHNIKRSSCIVSNLVVTIKQ